MKAMKMRNKIKLVAYKDIFDIQTKSKNTYSNLKPNLSLTFVEPRSSSSKISKQNILFFSNNKYKDNIENEDVVEYIIEFYIYGFYIKNKNPIIITKILD
jgi:hypothetical protein